MTGANTNILKTIWKITDIIRGRLSYSNYHIILFFISIYKDGILDEISENSLDLKKGLLSLFQNLNKRRNNEVYLHYYRIYQDSFESITHSEYIEILGILKNIDREYLDTNFSSIFDDILFVLAQDGGKYLGVHIQPKELTNFINVLFELPENAEVYNPFAGLVSFGINLKSDTHCLAQELDESSWVLGMLRIKAYGKEGQIDYRCEDSVINWQNSKKFDLIISHPPFLRWHNAEKKEMGVKYNTAEDFLINKGLSSLKSNGKLILLAPNRILYEGGTQSMKLRERLVKEDLIDTIISLPSGLLFPSSIPLTLIVIKKEKRLTNKVLFINAQEYVNNKGGIRKVFDYKKLIESLESNGLLQQKNGCDVNGLVQKNRKAGIKVKPGLSNMYNSHKDEFMRLVSATDIEKQKYNLNVSRYFIDVEKINNLNTELRHVIKPIKGVKQKMTEQDKFIRVGDLKDSNVDYQLEISQIEKTNQLGKKANRIDESCLLLATVGTKLKPTYFEFKGTPIFLNPNVAAFRINDIGVKVEIGFLINELQADYVREQVESYSAGVTIPHIPVKDLLSIKIDLPSMEEQRAKVKGLTELSERIKNLIRERDNLAHGISKESYDEFASLKHTLGRPRQNILSWSKSLIKFFEMNNFIELDDRFKTISEGRKGIIEVLKEIKDDVNFMTTVLEKGENGLKVEDYPLEVVSLKDVNKLIENISNSIFNFTIRKDLLENEFTQWGISTNGTLLNILLDNILTNCNKHAFKEDQKENLVAIELRVVDDYFYLEVKNNGLPFPKGVDKEKFIQKFSTADSKRGSGLGGYDINRIAKYFSNEDWKLQLNKEELYPVKFQFKFPIQIKE